MLELDKIRFDGTTQSRVQLNEDTVAEYAEAMREGVAFPAITVFFDGSDYWLADGFHRYHAARHAGLAQILEHVIPGTKREAILHSLGANANHGLRRTNADKRKAVETLLADAEWATWSNVQVAKACGVSEFLVRSIRDSIFDKNEDRPIDRTVTRNGTTYTQNTANIGKKPEAQVNAAASPALVAPSAPEPIEQTSASDAVQEDVDEYAPDAEELALLEAEHKADLRRMELLLDSDEPLAAVTEENKKLTAQLAALQLRLNSLLNEKSAAIDHAEKAQRKADRLAKELEKLKTWISENNMGAMA
ncbi:hypothetical protein E8K88_16490 [Lampropedia aestuarii]|uniref:ParB-like N-terminal domain-containing protein n=1 Tax=Lampropedia aestuarii TaxID=2562762 RepID=A0A4V3YWE0_9BURK|nr:ParB/Srx family N-terminal domain-containing protein [Lampropedia aestuarii]THJ30962.1 hypothetical protein E8K88_16490 [Lampropedia aestuarii]